MQQNFQQFLEQKKEDIVRKLANDRVFANMTDSCIELVEPKAIQAYLAVRLLAATGGEPDEKNFKACFVLIELTFGNCVDLAQMLQNYLIEAMESGCDMKIGEVKILDSK